MTTDYKQEMITESEAVFPYTASEAEFDSTTDGCAQWHWHNHFEIGVVQSGRLLLGVHNEIYTLQAGEGYFINSNVLHYCRAAEGEENVRVQTQMFDRGLIADAGAVGKRYVAPLENCIAMEVCALHPEDADQAEILNHFSTAFRIEQQKADGYELQVYAYLNLAWAKLYKLAKPLLHQDASARPENVARARKMLSYIHQHYAEPVCVRQIAAYTGVCERECFRSFAQYFNTTPMDYLIRYRISMAAKKLIETDDPIFQIANSCGFSSSSYFSMNFRQIMGKTPKEYRKQHSR